jgi:hypothetical protein
MGRLRVNHSRPCLWRSYRELASPRTAISDIFFQKLDGLRVLIDSIELDARRNGVAVHDTDDEAVAFIRSQRHFCDSTLRELLAEKPSCRSFRSPYLWTNHISYH